MNPRFLLIVKVPAGLNILDLPRPQSQGARVRRAVPVGSVLQALTIVNVAGAEYGWLVPQDPQKPEWVRVKDANTEYVDRIPLDGINNENAGVALAIKDLADAVRLLVGRLP